MLYSEFEHDYVIKIEEEIIRIDKWVHENGYTKMLRSFTKPDLLFIL